MSGTSIDSIDAACVEVWDSGVSTPVGPGISVRVVAAVEWPWPPRLREALLDVCGSGAVSLAQLCAAQSAVGKQFALAARHVIAAAGWSCSEIDAVASHGQTIWHQPSEIDFGGEPGRGTLQIGDPAVIAHELGCNVVSEFRLADMAAGGQGAPLVPFVDYLLCRSETYDTIALNIGGIANLTSMPAGAAPDEVIAFDTGPGCMMLDWIYQHITGHVMDSGGDVAAQGEACWHVVEHWMNETYFQLPPPKSTGRELFGEAAATLFLQDCRASNLEVPDILATAAAFTASAIAHGICKFCVPTLVSSRKRIFAGGGGCKNAAIMRELARLLPEFELNSYSSLGIDADAREAVAFAILGYQTLMERPGVLASATGARYAAVCGRITVAGERRECA